MSPQDKVERILKQIHLIFSEGLDVPDTEGMVAVDKNQVFAMLEQLNLAIYEIMDQYEATSQSRELAQRRSEKKGEKMLERISNQAEDVYAASLIYSDDALSRVQSLMEDAVSGCRDIWQNLVDDLEKEMRQVREDQLELVEQLQDFKDSNKYMMIVEECNREREREEQEKAGIAPEKRIQNEAKHYPMQSQPEIRVNPAYFERRRQEQEAEAAVAGGFAMQEGQGADAVVAAADVDSGIDGLVMQEGQEANANVDMVGVDGLAMQEGSDADVDIAGGLVMQGGLDADTDAEAADAGIGGLAMQEGLDADTDVVAAAGIGGLAMQEGLDADAEAATAVAGGSGYLVPEDDPEPVYEAPEIRVNLNAEYFKRQAQDSQGEGTDSEGSQGEGTGFEDGQDMRADSEDRQDADQASGETGKKREWKFRFGKRNS